MTKRRHRQAKLFRVTREERVQVSFYVEASSALKARRTPTPDAAERQLRAVTVGEAVEQFVFRDRAGDWRFVGTDRVIGGAGQPYSQPGRE